MWAKFVPFSATCLRHSLMESGATQILSYSVVLIEEGPWVAGKCLTAKLLLQLERSLLANFKQIILPLKTKFFYKNQETSQPSCSHITPVVSGSFWPEISMAQNSIGYRLSVWGALTRMRVELAWARALFLHWSWKVWSYAIIYSDIQLYGEKQKEKHNA